MWADAARLRCRGVPEKFIIFVNSNDPVDRGRAMGRWFRSGAKTAAEYTEFQVKFAHRLNLNERPSTILTAVDARDRERIATLIGESIACGDEQDPSMAIAD